MLFSPEMNIFLLRPLSEKQVNQLRQNYPNCQFQQSVDIHELESALPKIDVIFGNPPPKLLGTSMHLKWLQIVSSGFDEYRGLAGTGIRVTTAHGAHSESLAQHVVMSMLMFARGQLHFGTCQSERIWDRNPSIPFSLRGQTAGLIGFGSVGKSVKAMLEPWGLRFLVFKRTTNIVPGATVLDGKAGLDHLLNESHHVIISLPKTPETSALIDSRRVNLLRSDAYLYNISRGGLVDEHALLARLLSNTLGGVALDVFDQEPLPKDSPWWTAPNTIITPHIAGHHRDLGTTTFELFKTNLDNFLANRPLVNQANFSRGY